MPQDRLIDGVDQRDLLSGKAESSAREGFPIFFGEKLYAAKWRNFKLHFVWQVNATDPVLPLGIAGRVQPADKSTGEYSTRIWRPLTSG